MGNSASTDEFLLACQNNDLTKMKNQIKLKIDVNSENGFGVNGLHNACAQVLFIQSLTFSLAYANCSQGHLEAVNLLLSSKVNVNSVDARGDSPLIISVRGHMATYSLTLSLIYLRAHLIGGFEKIVQQLVKNKCDVNARNNNGITALHVACQLGMIEVVKLLLKVEPLTHLLVHLPIYLLIHRMVVIQQFLIKIKNVVWNIYRRKKVKK